MESLLDRLRAGARVTADGAWGTLLIDRGLPLRTPPEAWTLERPDVLSAIAREYLDAGAEILNSNTFGASPIRLRQHGLAHLVDEANTRAVTILREVAAGSAWISGSIGPTGRLLRPHGDLDPGEASEAFRHQATLLADAGADLLTIETMTDIAEAVLAVAAARSAAPALPIVATMTFDMTPRGPFTVMGTSVAQAARELITAGADVVGANCGAGLDAMLAVAREFRRHVTVPLAIRPNAGLPRHEGRRLVYPESADRFAEAAPLYGEAGVAILGGCCGTTPAHVRAIRSAFGGGRRDPVYSPRF